MPRVVSRFRWSVVALVVALVASACIVPWSADTSTFSVQSNVVYGRGEVDGGGTLTVMVRGGGFVSGSKSAGPVPSARVQARHEHYAGAGAPALATALVAAVDDALTALDFLHARDGVSD